METHTIEPADYTAHQPVAQTRLRGNRSGFSAFAHPRTDDKVRASFAYWSQYQGQVSGIITPISVHKNNNPSSQAARLLETSKASASITACWFTDDQHTRVSGYNGCCIGTPIVDHDNPLRKISGKFWKQAA